MSAHLACQMRGGVNTTVHGVLLAARMLMVEKANDGGTSGRRRRVVACAPERGRDCACSDGGLLRIKNS
jgi:hypothetical protein